MLPPNLAALQTRLRSIPHQNRTAEQVDMLEELDRVFGALDEVGSIRKSLTEDLERLTKRSYGVWGGAPGRCPLCGQ